MNLIQRASESKMRELINKLNQAANAYYNGKELITNFEYDSMLDELTKLEKSCNLVLPDSPNANVGYETCSSDKVLHEFPAKSLDKTKDVSKFRENFVRRGGNLDKVALMWKMDGCTLQLTYDDGKLVCAATRGDGYQGQNVTNNAKYIDGIPQTVHDKSKFTVRGEAVISYKDFEFINSTLDDSEKFKNPRNLASASVTLKDEDEVKNRHIKFFMFELVDHEKKRSWDFYDRVVTFSEKNGINHVFLKIVDVNKDTDNSPYIEDVISSNDFDPKLYPYPVDGLVGAYLNTEITDSLEGTAHHPNTLYSYALKWEDKPEQTTIRDIVWQPSRTGLLNPVAIFDPVEIDGTTVTKASLHNVSIMKKLHIHVGDKVSVIKANMIIPQIVENLSDCQDRDENYEYNLRVICPECGEHGYLIHSKNGILNMYCLNPKCSAILIDDITHYCSRECMDIQGLSYKTIERFVHKGIISCIADIYKLDDHKDEILSMTGFDKISYNNIISSIEHSSKHCTFTKFVSGLGIAHIGRSQAQKLSNFFKGDIGNFLDFEADKFVSMSIPGFGSQILASLATWAVSDRHKEADDIYSCLIPYINTETSKGNILNGLTFVITGSLNRFKNRKELEDNIVSNGGSVSSSVSKNTCYLICNKPSTSSKYKKAESLEIPIIDEDKYMEMLV